MSTHHPITPPLELVQRWHQEAAGTHFKPFGYSEFIAAKAAQWGADQELDAIEDEIITQGWFANSVHRRAQLRAARRPKPLTLKEQALAKTTAILNDLNRALLVEVRETLELNLLALEALND